MSTHTYSQIQQRGVTRHEALIAYSLLALLTALPCAAQQRERVKIDLQPVRWQLLPPTIRSVCVGPDGRNWYQTASDDSKPSLAELRTVLEKEYRETSPQLSSASLALLEPNGRAWFYVKPDELWGYDGKEWIEHKAGSGSKFTGYCTSRGQLLDNHANRFVAGRAWFRDEQGIHIFDGQQWNYTTLCPPINSENHLPRFSVSPNGKYAVAITPGLPGRIVNLANPDLWFWQDESATWRKVAVIWGDKTSVFASFCITDEGKLWCTQGGLLRILDVAGSRDVLARFSELIAQLNDDDAPVRQRATQTLDDVAELIFPRLQAAHTSVNSSEARTRLRAIIDRVTLGKDKPAKSPFHPIVGSYKIHAIGDIFHDDGGRLFLFAAASQGDMQPPQGGLVLVDSTGDAKLFPVGPIANIRTPFHLLSVGREHGPILTITGNALWMNFSAFGRFARRLDLQTGEVIKQDSDANYRWLQAVNSDGDAFLVANDIAVRPGISPGVFSPGIQDSRPLLAVQSHPVLNPECIVASDGKVWAARQQGLSRYDGRAWEDIYPVDRGQMYPTLAGRNGVMVCRTSAVRLPLEYALFQGNKFVGIAPLRKLIATHSDIFLAGFPPSYTPLQRYYRIWIATDLQRNIWLKSSEPGVAVFTEGKWVESPQGKDAPQVLRNGEGAKAVLSVGDGSKILIAGALASLEEGRMTFMEAPTWSVDAQMPFGFRDSEGALWLPSYAKEVTPSKFPPGSPQYLLNRPRRENRTIRVTERGPLEELPVDAWPFLIDASNVVWLAAMGQGRPLGHFWIWREGKIVQELQIPGAQEMRTICSDKPGSVFVGTGLGLHHFVEHVENGKQFRLKQTYSLPDSITIPNQYSCPYSNLAGLVVPISRELTFIPRPQ